MLVRVGPLPDAALAASALFHAEVLPCVMAQLAQGAESVVLVFEPADHTHRAWRMAAVEGLAREAAPHRINAVESADEAAIAAACTYLHRAPGITGHVLPLDSHGAGEVISSCA